MGNSDRDLEKLAEARVRDEERRKAELQRANEREARVMRQVRDTDLEENN